MLDIGAALAALLAIAGIVYARQVRHDPPPLADPAAARRTRIIWGIEFGAIAAGWAILAATAHPQFIAAWVCLVVGVHFVPLDRVFPGIGLVGLGIAVTLVAVAAFIVGLSTTTLPSTVAGLGTGACLLVHGTSLLIAARRHQADHRSDPDASIA